MMATSSAPSTRSDSLFTAVNAPFEASRAPPAPSPAEPASQMGGPQTSNNNESDDYGGFVNESPPAPSSLIIVGHSDTSTSTPKGKKAACEVCRTAKIRCNRDIPGDKCQKCSETAQDCHIPSGSSRPRRKHDQSGSPPAPFHDRRPSKCPRLAGDHAFDRPSRESGQLGVVEQSYHSQLGNISGSAASSAEPSDDFTIRLLAFAEKEKVVVTELQKWTAVVQQLEGELTRIADQKIQLEKQERAVDQELRDAKEKEDTKKAATADIEKRKSDISRLLEVRALLSCSRE